MEQIVQFYKQQYKKLAINALSGLFWIFPNILILWNDSLFVLANYITFWTAPKLFPTPIYCTVLWGLINLKLDGRVLVLWCHHWGL